MIMIKQAVADAGAARGLGALVITLLTGSGAVHSAAVGAQAHVHGQALLEVSVDGPVLLIALRGPAQVFYGFEHSPSTPKEAAVIRETITLLQAPTERVLALDTVCILNAVVLDAPFVQEAQGWDGDAEFLGHEHHYRHEGHESSKDEGARTHGYIHADLEAQYTYRCTDAPSRLTVNAFTIFPALASVEANWINDDAAGSARLTASSPQLDFEPN